MLLVRGSLISRPGPWAAILACWIVIAGPMAYGAESFGDAESLPPLEGSRVQAPEMPIAFEANHGQLAAPADYLARAPGVTFLFESSGPVLSLQPPGSPTPPRLGERPGLDLHALGETNPPAEPKTVRVQFEDSSADVVIQPGARLPGHVNYLLGDDASAWVTHVPIHEEIRYVDLWLGIDLTYASHDGSMKGTYLVSADADAADIRWHYENATDVRLTPAGDLEIDPGDGFAPVVERAPIAWQDDEERTPVPVSFRIHDDGSIGFELGAFDSEKGLVIDPTIDYLHVFGGPDGFDIVDRVAVDEAGNAFVVGHTSSRLFPTNDAMQEDKAGGISDLFIVKMREDGEGFHYATYLGGEDLDNAYGLAVDDAGHAYVSGSSRSPDFPTTPGAYQESWIGKSERCGNFDCTDGIVAKLAPDGASLVFSTFIGGSLEEQVRDVSVAADGTVYAGGLTFSRDFPTTEGAFQPELAGGGDAWVARLESDGSELVFSTYVGGSGRDMGWAGVTVDPDGNAIVLGSTNSQDLATDAALQEESAGGTDLFLAKIAPDGRTAPFVTYLGGSSTETPTQVLTDAVGDIFLTGYTASPDFPTHGGVQAGHGGSYDAFATKISGDGSTILFSTLLGGSNTEFATGIALAGDGSIYLSGSTESTDFPVHHPTQPEHGGAYDAFLAKIDPQGSLTYATWIGGDGRDFGSGVAVDADGRAYLGGQTASIFFPSAQDFDPLDARVPPLIEPDAFLARVLDTVVE